MRELILSMNWKNATYDQCFNSGQTSKYRKRANTANEQIPQTAEICFKSIFSLSDKYNLLVTSRKYSAIFKIVTQQILFNSTGQSLLARNIERITNNVESGANEKRSFNLNLFLNSPK